jgi:hypothetical protein
MAQGGGADRAQARKEESLNRAIAAAALLMALAGLACLGLALYGHLGNRDVRTHAVQSGDGPLMPMAMNPMRITVTANVNESNRAQLRNARENYLLSLYRNGRPLRRWQATLVAEDEDRKPRAQASFSVEPVEIAESGAYQLLLLRPDGDAAPGFAGHVLRLEREGARPADVTRAWQGAILLVLGLTLFLLRMPAMRG